MSKIFKGTLDLIGKTPLVEVTNIEKELGLEATVLVKLEYLNPAGSVKDRIAKAMIEDAEKSGALKPGSVIIEPTSGNTGIGLASIAAAKGYRIILTMPETMSVERRNILKAYGAEIVLTEGAKGMKGAIAKAEELKAEIPGGFIPGQFVNPANPKIHRETTGPEIWEDTDGKVDIFVGGVGTGGSTHGVSKFLKEKNSKIKTVIAQPDRADVEHPVVQGVEDGGFHGIHAVHDENGLNPMAPTNFNEKVVDEYETISYAETLRAIHLLAHYEGIFVGASSGAALAIAIKQALKDENKDKLIVPLLPDNGERYLSEDLQRVREDVEKKAGF